MCVLDVSLAFPLYQYLFLQVRDFAFSPDSGQITHLSYDSLGLPTVPEALLNVYEVDMDSVLELRSGLVVLRRGAERSTILVSSGILGYALDKVKVSPGCWLPTAAFAGQSATLLVQLHLCLLQNKRLYYTSRCIIKVASIPIH